MRRASERQCAERKVVVEEVEVRCVEREGARVGGWVCMCERECVYATADAPRLWGAGWDWGKGKGNAKPQGSGCRVREQKKNGACSRSDNGLRTRIDSPPYSQLEIMKWK